MVLTNWLRLLSRRLSNSRARSGKARRRRLPQSLTRSIEALEDRTLLNAAWVNVGPFGAEGGQSENAAPNDRISGAIEAVLAHPTNANIMYVGSVNGGVWRTFNATDPTPDWDPLTDDQPGNSIGALVFDNADLTRQTIYAGTAAVSSFGRVSTSRVGLLRTTDGGQNWTVVDGGGTLANRNVKGIVANGTTITVATEFGGIFRSTDGGATFGFVGGAGGLPSGRTYDLVQVPADANTLYTAFARGSSNGIYKSTNGGANWTKVSDGTVDALFTNSTNNVELAAGDLNQVFVGIVNSGRVAAFFHSPDAGATWNQMDLPSTTEGGTTNGLHPGGQGSIHFSMAVDPSNANILYAGGDRQPSPFPNEIGGRNFSGRLFRGDASQASGSQWTPLTHNGTVNTSSPHADSRDMVVDASGSLIEVDDGGVWRRTSPRDATGDWFSINGDLAIAEAHNTAYDSVSNTVHTGNQDNASAFQPTAGAQLWNVFGSGDGGDVVVDDVSLAGSGQSIRYSSAQFLLGFVRSTWDSTGNFVSAAFPALTLTGGGQNLQGGFVTPIAVNAINPQRIVIHASNGVYESSDQGETVSEVGATADNGSIQQDAIAYGGRRNGTDNADVLWVGAGTNVFFRQAAGNLAAVAADPTNQTVRDLTIDVDDWATAFIIDQNQVFQTTDMGGAWTDVTGNLMSFANQLYSITFFASAAVDALLVGTDRGVFAASTTDFSTWVRVGDDALPNVIVDELDWDQADDLLVAGTFGRGAWVLNGLEAEVVNLVGPARLNVSVDMDLIAENGGTATATVTRNGPLTSPLVVNLMSSDVSEATVPATVTILANQSSATFTVTGVDDLLQDGRQIVTITAQSTGFADGTASIGVIDNETATLTLEILPTEMDENGGTAIATLTRRSGAGNNLDTFGDLAVTLTSSDTTEAVVPGSIVIPDGQASVTFVVASVDDAVPDGVQTVTVTAAAQGFSDGTDTIDVLDDEALSFTATPLQINENGGVAIGTVTRNLGTVGPLVVQLSSSDTSEATVPATVTIPNGQASATFQISAVNDLLADGNQPVTITANAPGLGTKTVRLVVVDDDVATLSLSVTPTSFSEGGGFAVATVARNTPPTSDLIVQLSSSDTTEATVPPFVIIPAGSFTTTFIVSAVNDNLADPVQLVTITATAAGHLDATAVVRVVDDDSVAIRGTNGDDVFFFVAGDPGQSHRLRVNGVWQVLPVSVRIVRILGEGGNDRLWALGTSLADNVTLSPGAAHFTGPGLDLTSVSVETNTIDGRGGANGMATLFDGAGNDVYFSDPTGTVLFGAGFHNDAFGFSRSVATANNAGSDRAIFRDSVGNDTFDARPNRSAMAGPGYVSIGRGFERSIARAVRGGVRDVAFLYDGPGDDSYSTNPTQSLLMGPGLFYAVFNFDNVQAITSQGFDAANVWGTGGNDTAIVRDRVASIAGPGFVTDLFNFDRMTINGGGGSDTAFLYDSAGNDLLTAAGNTATLQGPGFLNRVIGFDRVTAYGFFGINRKNIGSVGFLYNEFGNWV